MFVRRSAWHSVASVPRNRCVRGATRVGHVAQPRRWFVSETEYNSKRQYFFYVNTQGQLYSLNDPHREVMPGGPAFIKVN